MNMERDELHRLVEEIPESEIMPATRYLRYLREFGEDPLLKKLMSAPIDDEPETEEEVRGVEQARKELEAGDILTTEELKRELGL